MRTKSSTVIDKPTKREAEVLDFVRAYRRENGYSPALTEVAKHFNRSIPTVHQHIQSLGKKIYSRLIRVRNDQSLLLKITNHHL